MYTAIVTASETEMATETEKEKKPETESGSVPGPETKMRRTSIGGELKFRNGHRSWGNGQPALNGLSWLQRVKPSVLFVQFKCFSVYVHFG